MANPFLRRHRTSLLFGGATLAVLLFFYLAASGSFPALGRSLRAAAHVAAWPAVKGFGWVSGRLSFSADQARELGALRLELTRTRRELLAFQYIHDELKQVRREKDDLTRALGYRKRLPWKNVPARILFKDPQNLFTTLTLDVGHAQSVREGDPVLGFTDGILGLVGKVYDAEYDTCRVLTLIDPRCQVGVLLEDTGDAGLLRGQAPANLSCSVEYLDRRLERLEGRVLVTAGTGGKYPRGIFIGRITEVIRKRFGLFQETYCQPHINFFTLDEVFILTREEAPPP
ncbi:MAG: rod shape-determining protein MreC [Spirochaetes bacterium]|nr:rod shape-determining protein MreC [Spirochaetota bacterium]